MAIVNAGTLAFLLKKEMAIATVATTVFCAKEMAIVTVATLPFAKIEMTIATVATTVFCAKEMAITTVATTAICQNLNGYCYCRQQYVGLTSLYPQLEKAI